MTKRTFDFRTGGPFEIVGASQTVEGAFDGTFTEAWKHVTFLTKNPDVIAGMGMADCDLTYNLEADISETVCAAWRPVSVCGEDHDLIAMTAAGVQFGVRPADNDMCTADKRPTALLPVVARIRPVGGRGMNHIDIRAATFVRASRAEVWDALTAPETIAATRLACRSRPCPKVATS